jgi:hypothetical protein
MFLSKSEVSTLTGRTWRKLQVEALRRMGLPFVVNPAGWPIVTKAAL